MNHRLLLLSAMVLMRCAAPLSLADDINQLTEAERADGWRLLFDGQTTAGWKGYKRDDAPGTWEVQDGSLFMNSEEQTETVGIYSLPSNSLIFT